MAHTLMGNIEYNICYAFMEFPPKHRAISIQWLYAESEKLKEERCFPAYNSKLHDNHRGGRYTVLVSNILFRPIRISLRKQI